VKDFPTPAEAPSPVLGGIEVERAPAPPPVVFVGGTGRSGTHVLAQLISRHARFALVPVEVRFHTDPEGFPGLLAGEVTPQAFVRRLRGFWWRGFQTNRMRGMYRFVDRERFAAAVERFEAEHAEGLEQACRNLFFDLLWFRTSEGEKAAESEALVEQSTDNIAAAPTLTRLFPEARFIHVVRDGRDASASRVAQTRGLVRPRTRVQGIEWWEQRIRAIEAGADAVAPGRLLTVCLDELLLLPRARAALRPMFRFLGVPPTKRTRRYFRKRMTSEEANTERWRRGISGRKAERIEALYAAALERLEADGARCAPLLRHAYERSGGADEALAYVYDRSPR
jgi:Sulfotransferase family